MTVIPGKNSILATDAGLGVDIVDFSNGAAAGVAAGKSSGLAIDGQSATCWSSFSPKTGNFYVTDIGTSQITEINVDDNLKPSIVTQYAQGAGTATIDNDIATVGQNECVASPSSSFIRADSGATLVSCTSLPPTPPRSRSCP